MATMKKVEPAPPPEPFRIIALDFDGVVVDSMPRQERAWRAAVSSVYRQPRYEEAVVRNLYAGKAGERMFDGIRMAADKRRRLREAKDALWRRVRNRTPLKQGAKEVIPQLAARYDLAIATTADRPYVERILAREGLERYICRIVTDSEVVHPKPAPDLIVALARHFAVDAQQICVVGDTENDRKMSRAAGAHFIRFAGSGGAGTGRARRGGLAISWHELGRLLGAR